MGTQVVPLPPLRPLRSSLPRLPTSDMPHLLVLYQYTTDTTGTPPGLMPVVLLPTLTVPLPLLRPLKLSLLSKLTLLNMVLLPLLHMLDMAHTPHGTSLDL